MKSVTYKNKPIISAEDLDLLHSQVEKSGEVSRICYHESVDSPLHVMLICMPENQHYPTHRHTDSDEKILVLKGVLTITLFNSIGEIEDVVHLQALSQDSESDLGLVIKKCQWHDVASGQQETTFLEVKAGPFVKDNMEYLTTSGTGDL